VILRDIREYLKKRKQATLADIALHVQSEPDAVRGMLQRLEQKGQVRRENIDLACGSSCDKCTPAAREIYFWIEA